MAAMMIIRFRCPPDDEQQMLRERAALISDVRRRILGLEETRLGRSHQDRSWVDIWRWDSGVSIKSAVGAGLPESAVESWPVTDVSTETVDLVEWQ